MRISVFSTKSYDREYLDIANKKYGYEIVFLEAKLDIYTASLANESKAVCVFVNDIINREVLEILSKGLTRLIALRSAGFNNVDLEAANHFGIKVVRVPAYSPHSVAEHTIALLLALNRKIYKAHNRIRDGNFSIEGLLGFDIYGKIAGIIGTGKIGTEIAKILIGFGCKVIAYDEFRNPELEKLGVCYSELKDMFRYSDIITLHCPLIPDTFHLINDESIHLMKKGVVLLNTSRGALIDTRAVIKGLKRGKIGYLGLDVYEEEGDLFFQDLSNIVIQDDVFARLLTFPNVIVTGHQAFFTKEAITNITETTLLNIYEFETTKSCRNEVTTELIK